MTNEAHTDVYKLMPHATAALAGGAARLHEPIREFKTRVGDKPVRLVTVQSPVYPRRVEEFCRRPPAYLISYGNMQVLGSRTFCVLASRNAGDARLERVESVSEAG